MKKKCFLVVLVFLVLTSYAQVKDTVYLDEEFDKISFQKFIKKSESRLFVISSINSDTTLYKKLRFKEYFGKLNHRTKDQLNKFLDSKYKIDSSKIWLIHYTRTFKLRRNKSNNKVLITNVNLDLVKSRLEYNSYIDAFEKLLSPLKKVYKKKYKNTELIHLYKYNEKILDLKNDSISHFRYLNKFVENFFTDGISTFKTIVIHPNGDFYADNRLRGKSHSAPLALSRKAYNKNKVKWLRELNKLVH